jgi:signal transduction histidine kinase
VGLLTAGVSHEILNPLNVITLRLHTLISNPDTPPEVTRYLRIMEKHANRITKITRDLLSFSRQREPKRRLIDLNESIKRTLSLLEHGLRIQNIEVESKLSDELPPGLADQDQLQQMVLNLPTNAKDAMPDGGHLSLTTKAVQTNGQMFIELRVEDTGEGIAPEDLENLFDPFFTTKDEGKGTGLGLSICQGIVEDYGGSIWAENVPDGGAAFVVRFGTEDE